MKVRKSYFKLAKNTSRLSNHRVRVGAVIVKKKPLIACSNILKTHPIYANPYEGNVGSIHAEIRCVLHLGDEDLRGSTIYVYREYKNGHPALARPCKLCMGVLEEVGVKEVFYSTGEYPYYKRERIC